MDVTKWLSIWVLGCSTLILLWFWRSERKARMKQMEDLEKLYWMARQVAHDVASPLTALDAVARDPGLSPHKRELLTLAKSRTEEIVRDLKHQTSAIWKVKQKIHFHSLKGMINDVIKEKSAIYQSIQFRFVWKPSSGSCFLNPVDLKRALSNLLQNAVEALPKSRGKIVITANSTENHSLQLQISDTGKGIPAENLALLGEPGMTLEKPDGQGLGLSQAKSFVQDTGGELFINSAPDRGTTVSIMLPSEGSSINLTGKSVLT